MRRMIKRETRKAERGTEEPLVRSAFPLSPSGVQTTPPPLAPPRGAHPARAPPAPPAGGRGAPPASPPPPPPGWLAPCPPSPPPPPAASAVPTHAVTVSPAPETSN